MKVQWDPELAIGNAEVDGQHKELFNRINALLEAMAQGKGKSEIAGVLTFLEDYTKTHFAAEERLMTMHNYPGLQAQKVEHAKFMKDLQALKQEFDPKSLTTISTIIQVQSKTVDWLRNHISKMDKEIGRFLKDKKFA